ncbi:hypothetical protein M422DRAFT_276593, partial [Sphaerobolus stellatus SS14]
HVVSEYSSSLPTLEKCRVQFAHALHQIILLGKDGQNPLRILHFYLLRFGNHPVDIVVGPDAWVKLSKEETAEALNLAMRHFHRVRVFILSSSKFVVSIFPKNKTIEVPTLRELHIYDGPLKKSVTQRVDTLRALNLQIYIGRSWQSVILPL